MRSAESSELLKEAALSRNINNLQKIYAQLATWFIPPINRSYLSVLTQRANYYHSIKHDIEVVNKRHEKHFRLFVGINHE